MCAQLSGPWWEGRGLEAVRGAVARRSRRVDVRWWVLGTGYWVLGGYTACIAGQIRQAQRSRARAVELTCSERWAGRGQAAWAGRAGQGSSTGQ